MTKTICFVAGSARDWGGAGRVLFTNVRMIDRTRFDPLVLLPYRGHVVGELDRLGVRYRIWGPLHEMNGWSAYIGAVWRAIRMFRDERVALLHINIPCWRPAELIAAKLLRIPVLLHYHMLTTQPGPSSRWVDSIVAVSRFVAENSGPADVKKDVVYNPIQLQRFHGARSVREELGLPHDAIVVTFVGQVRTLKGIDLFLRVARAIPDDRVRFLIVGKCEGTAKLQDAYTESRLASEIGDDSRILYAGYRSDIENIFASSDIIVVPSRVPEAFPLVIIEAGAVGRPVVAARVGGIPEMIDHGVNGYLVESDDADGLRDHVLRLVSDRTSREQMGVRAREFVEQRFARKPIEDLQTLYDSLTS